MCYGLISFANKHASTSAITAFWPVQVVMAVVLSFIVFGDRVTPQQIGGAVMIAAGLFSVVLATRRQEARKANEQQPLLQPSHEASDINR